MSDRAEPTVSFYRGVYAVGCLVIVAVCALGAAWAVRSGWWWAAAPPLAVLAGLLVAVKRRVAELRAYAHIPGPRPSLFVGNLPALMDRGHGGRDQAIAALHAEYGPVVKIHLAWGSGPYVSLSYASSNIHRKDLDSQRRADRTLLPSSLMGLERDERHKAHRQTMGPFFSASAVRDNGHVVRKISEDYVARWKADGGVGLGDLQAEIHRWSAQCMGAFLFGSAWDADADLREYFDALAAIEEEISFRAFHPFFVRWIFPRRAAAARAAYRYLAAFLGRILARRAVSGCPHRAGGHTDMLGEFLRLRGEGAWSHHESVEEMMSLVLGGTDAMSNAIGQALVLLSRSPTVQSEARRRIASARRATGPSTPEVPYVKYILYEAYRLFPPVPFSAKIAHDGFVEGDLAIPPGATVMWAKNVVGRNAAVFHDPECFRPERFEYGHESAALMLPFGAGPRHCIGNRLADEQCTGLLTAILRTFHLDALDGVDVKYRATVTITPNVVPVLMTPLR